MGGVLSCSPCPFGAIELSIIGKSYIFYVAQDMVSLLKCDFEILDLINRKSWQKLEEHLFFRQFLNINFVL